MRIIFLGDIMGRSGRDAVAKHLPVLKEHFSSDVVIVNGENAAHGIGISAKICKEFYDAGADVITTGNHIWDQKDIMSYIDSDPKLIRPLNYPETAPGNGLYVHKLSQGRSIAVLNVMGSAMMPPPSLHHPFPIMEDALKPYRLGQNINAIFVDFHAEATAEKMVCGHHLDGRVSAVVGTHTHIPTADAHILPKGTAYQTDAGMCGDYDSIIGMKKEEPIRRFTTMMRYNTFGPANGEATVCGCFIETDDNTGLSKQIVPFQVGGLLGKALPEAA